MVPSIAVALSCLLSIAAAEDDQRPTTFPIPNRPEGITNGPGSALLVSQILTGAVLSVDALTAETKTVVPPQDQSNGARQAWGLWHHHDAIFVCGGGPPFFGGTPKVYVYNATDGSELAACDPYSTNTDLNATFMNDVTVIGSTAYATDSFNNKIMMFDADEAIENGQCVVSELVLPDTFKPKNASDWGPNGLVEYADGLLVVAETRGFVYHVANLDGGQNDDNGPTFTEVIPPGVVKNGDGLEVLDDRLYVTRNFDDVVDVFKLETRAIDNDGNTTVVATFLGNITSSQYKTPATSALYSGYVYSANTRFAESNSTDYDVVAVKDPYYRAVAGGTSTTPLGGTDGGKGSGARSERQAFIGGTVACMMFVSLFW